METKLPLEVLNNVSEIDIIYTRNVKCKMSERPVIVSSLNGYELFSHYWNHGKIGLVEEFKVMFLNRANKVLQIMSVSQGGITGTVADPRIILAAALNVAACSMIMAHNHPSGALKPSKADEELTMKIKTAASYFDIKLLDHIILSSEGYLSFADEGLL